MLPRPFEGTQEERAAWQLVLLARDLRDEMLADFAGKLLALVGPLDAHVTAFSMPASGCSPAIMPSAAQLSTSVSKVKKSSEDAGRHRFKCKYTFTCCIIGFVNKDNGSGERI
jgi:hypothetical protein